MTPDWDAVCHVAIRGETFDRHTDIALSVIEEPQHFIWRRQTVGGDLTEAEWEAVVESALEIVA